VRILDALVPRTPAPAPESRYSFNEYMMAFAGNQYSMGGSHPNVPNQDFVDYIDGVHKRNGVVAAAVTARALLVSQLRFKWRRTYGAGAGDLWGNRDLRPLEQPGTEPRPAFLHRLEVDASYAGSAYVVRDGNQLRRLRPDHCTVVLGSNSDPEWDGSDELRVPYDADILALLYHPGKYDLQTGLATVFMPGQFTIWSPEPDPVAFWRGTSWVTSVMREITADGQATDHQTKFFDNAATPNLVFLMDPSKTPEETQQFADITNKLHAGPGNSYKSMYLGGGTDVKVVGSTLDSLNLKDLTGGFETRVALRARIPGVILGVREGYAGSSLNQGNYNSARRMLADGWLAPTVEGLCAALERVLTVPADSELFYDRSAILFLQEDEADAADIISTQTSAMRTLVDGGFDPDSVVEAVSKGDLTKLVHTGKLSVQLQPPGTGQEPPARSELRAIEPVAPSFTVHNHIPEGRDIVIPAPEVSVDVAAPDVRMDAPVVNVNVPEQRQDAPVVNVTVDPTPVTIENNNQIDVAPATVPAAQVTIIPNDDTPSTFKVRRDGQGRISEVVEDD